MQQYLELPDSLRKTHNALEPYIKQRKEATRIRQTLAAHLSSQAHQKEGYPIFHPLSLVEASPSAGSASNGVKGLQREYIQCLRANIKARNEFSKTSKEHQPKATSHNQSRGASRDISEVNGDFSSTLPTFIDVVKHRRRHERLRIVQDYVDTVAQKAPVTTDQIVSGVALDGLGSLPQVPPEVMGTTETCQGTERTDLKDLVNQLEKAVLGAKLLLQREQKFLAKIKNRNNTSSDLSSSSGGKLQALGTTRNELINWIETELAKTADDSADSENTFQLEDAGIGDEDFINEELVSIQRQYNQYSKLRRALILAATGHLDQPNPAKISQNGDEVEASDTSYNSDSKNHINHAYLTEMMSISNEQKAMIQQKSYSTISLAKHLKEAGQGVGRLSEESHLLPAYPIPGTTPHGSGFDGLASFGGSISSHERPDSSRKARAWVFAADSSRAATNNAILGRIDKGRIDVHDAQQTLLELQRLLGEDNDTDQMSGAHLTRGGKQANCGDVWASLAGNLGTIK